MLGLQPSLFEKKISGNLRRMTRPNAKSGTMGGVTLVEVLVGTVIILIAGLAVIKGFQSISLISVRSGQEMRVQRILREFKSTLDSLPFEIVFPVDSALPNWGLGAQPSYGGSVAMGTLLSSCRSAGFPRFTIEVTFLRRDTSNVLGNGTSALIPFTDLNSDGIDDYDPNIRFRDQWSVPGGLLRFVDANNDNIDDVNGTPLASVLTSDGDFFDSCLHNGRMFTDMPNTNLRQVKISLFSFKDPSKPFAVQEYLISKEKLSGNSGFSAERDLAIAITSPAEPRFFFAKTNDANTFKQITAQNEVLSIPYPALAYQADNQVALTIQGRTNPNARVFVSTQTPPSQAPAGFRDEVLADFSGNFTITASNTTNNLEEGLNRIYYEATKDVVVFQQLIQMQSPIGRFDAIMDLRRPRILSEQPTSNNVKTLSPVVGALFTDLRPASTTTVSGICPDVITIAVDPQGPSPKVMYSGQDVNYNPTTKLAKWWNPANHLPVTLVNGQKYDIDLEGGDWAHYGRKNSWNFKIDIDVLDLTPPVLTWISPNPVVNVPSPVVVQFKIEDNDSGIDFSSVEVTVDNVPVLNSVVTPFLGDFIDADQGIVTLPPRVCPSGAVLDVKVKARHWGLTGNVAQDWLPAVSTLIQCQ